uniref:Uncharacterized protein n=1 Tax=Timema tahoe TaxID=61484 RepID=A0A7R9FPA6_9NEOP|nr:unnamed protein product [Timema tahoe]
MPIEGLYLIFSERNSTYGIRMRLLVLVTEPGTSGIRMRLLVLGTALGTSDIRMRLLVLEQCQEHMCIRMRLLVLGTVPGTSSIRMRLLVLGTIPGTSGIRMRLLVLGTVPGSSGIRMRLIVLGTIPGTPSIRMRLLVLGTVPGTSGIKARNIWYQDEIDSTWNSARNIWYQDEIASTWNRARNIWYQDEIASTWNSARNIWYQYSEQCQELLVSSEIASTGNRARNFWYQVRLLVLGTEPGTSGIRMRLLVLRTVPGTFGIRMRLLVLGTDPGTSGIRMRLLYLEQCQELLVSSEIASTWNSARNFWYQVKLLVLGTEPGTSGIRMRLLVLGTVPGTYEQPSDGWVDGPDALQLQPSIIHLSPSGLDPMREGLILPSEDVVILYFLAGIKAISGSSAVHTTGIQRALLPSARLWYAWRSPPHSTQPADNPASDFPYDSYLSEPMSPRASFIAHNGDQHSLVIQSDQPHRQFKSALPYADDLIHSSQSFSTCVLHVRHEVAPLIQHHAQVSGVLASSYLAISSSIIRTGGIKNNMDNCGLLVRVPGYRSIGPRFDPQRFQNLFVKQWVWKKVKLGLVRTRCCASLFSRPSSLSSALAQAAPPTLSTAWTAPQSMFSKPSVTSSPLYLAPKRTPASIGSRSICLTLLLSTITIPPTATHVAGTSSCSTATHVAGTSFRSTATNVAGTSFGSTATNVAGTHSPTFFLPTRRVRRQSQQKTWKHLVSTASLRLTLQDGQVRVSLYSRISSIITSSNVPANSIFFMRSVLRRSWAISSYKPQK